MSLGSDHDASIRVVCAPNPSDQFGESHEGLGLELAVQPIHDDRHRRSVCSYKLGHPNPEEAPVDRRRTVARVQPNRILPGCCEPRLRNCCLPTSGDPVQKHQPL